MAGSVNKVTLVGNLGKDPETRTTQQGLKIVSFNIATSESWNDKSSGERQERTEWHRIVVMNDRLAETAEKYLKKGSKVYLEGKLQTRKWTDQAGQEKYTTEVMLGRFGAEMVLLDRPAGGATGGGTYSSNPPAPRGGNQGGGNQGGSQGSNQGGGWDSGRGNFGNSDLDDEIPF